MLGMIALIFAAAQSLAPSGAAVGTPPAPTVAISAGQREQAWTLGYSSFVRHVCSGWDQRIDAFSNDVLPSAATWNGPWAEDGALAIAHRAGLHAAETAQRADPSFCDHPTRDQPERAALLDRVLMPRAAKR